MVAVFVVLTIILFVLADFILQKVRARRMPAPAVAPRTGAADLLLPNLQPERFALPGGLFFHRGHTWANLLFSGQVKIGIDDFLQKLLGRIDGVTLPPIGVEVKAGQPFVALRQGDRTAMLSAPVDGVVCAVNQELAKAPSLLRRDPYTRGWLVAIRPKDLNANMSLLMVGEKSREWLTLELGRFADFVRGVMSQHQDVLVGATAADGGLSADGLLERLDDEHWTEFQGQFLNV
jgi:glycine cleavage system H lipoate-binding protein